MSVAQCAAMLREADPDRFAITLAAQPRDRARLATLYAANLEIARAATVSAEPLVSEMRLQFWADQIEAIRAGRTPYPHEVSDALRECWGPEIAPLATLVEARRRDTERQPFQSESELLDYIDATSGVVMGLAARSCRFNNEAMVQAQARGAGLASWLSALPRLAPLGLGLGGQAGEAVPALARLGIAALDEAGALARAGAGPDRRAAPACYAGACARLRLRQLAAGQTPNVSAFRERASRAALALTGRWQG